MTGQEPSKKQLWKQVALSIFGLKWVPWLKNVLWLTATGLAIKAGAGGGVEGAILTFANGGQVVETNEKNRVSTTPDKHDEHPV